MPLANAQLPGIGAPAKGEQLPAGVQRQDEIETKSVEFDGVPLFRIASPRVVDRDKPGDLVPVEVRARQAESELKAFLEVLLVQDQKARPGSPTPLEKGKPEIITEAAKDAIALVAHGDGLSQPKILLLVTPQDGEYQQSTLENLADHWRDQIIERLNAAVRDRRPGARQEHLSGLKTTVLVVLGTQAVLFGINLLIRRRQSHLRTLIEENDVSAPSPGIKPAEGGADTRGRETIGRLLETVLSLENRFKLLVFLRWFVVWMMLSVWLGGFVNALYLLPETRKLALYLVTTPFYGLVAFFLAGLANRIGDIIVDRSLATWQTNQLVGGNDLAHMKARLATVSGAIRALKFVVIYSIALVWLLSKLQIVPWSLVTVGAIVALAVSFAAQSLVKDVVMGILILLEDQYTIGDYVTVLDVTGTVEYMNLRITRIRTADGRLVTLPNSSIVKVENLSRSWATITVEFEFLASARVDHVVATIRALAEGMAKEPEWANKILDPHEWVGVSTVTRTGTTVGVSVRTKPLEQWAVGRELRRRIKNAVDDEERVREADASVAE